MASSSDRARLFETDRNQTSGPECQRIGATIGALQLVSTFDPGGRISRRDVTRTIAAGVEMFLARFSA